MKSEITVHLGDSRDVLKTLADNSIDSVVCDPPYSLVSIGKRFGADNAAPAKTGKSGAYARASAGFMGKKWDTGETAFAVEFWAEVMRVLKPGGHVVAFSGTRTYHRLACAVEDAGFEIRDMVAWLYGSGFPKSHDVSKGIDKAAGAVREKVRTPIPKVGSMGVALGGDKAGNTRPWIEKARASGFHDVTSNEPATEAARQWQGWGTALKPALEPIVLARKPLEGTVAANVLAHGTGTINVDGCRVGTEGGARSSGEGERTESQSGAIGAYKSSPIIEGLGRWPANLIHDGSEEVVGAFPDSSGGHDPSKGKSNPFGGMNESPRQERVWADSGSAARFFKALTQSEEELLFCSAKAILNEWNTDLANTADASISLSKEAVDFALSDAVTSAFPVTVKSYLELSTNVTASELRRLLISAIMAILTIGKESSLASQPEKLIQTGCRVSGAENQNQTGTTTITISHWRSDGSADPVTLTITSKSMEAGEADCLSGNRTFYTAKADATERLGTKHPTVKPTDLMAYLIRLVTPPGGTTLDPFAGSGSTGVAAVFSGFNAVLIEREPEYHADILRRIAWAKGEGGLTMTQKRIPAARQNTDGDLFA